VTETDFGLTPLAGGSSGETFLGHAARERTVVRIYGARSAARGPDAPVVDAAVLRLVRGLLPVPDVLDVRRPDPRAGTPGLLVTSFLAGERLDLLLPRLDDDELSVVGRAAGGLLARLAAMPMPRPGLFVDGDLHLGPSPAGDLVDVVESRRAGTALAAWAPDLYDRLLAVADRATQTLARVQRTCLVHGDLAPENLLVDRATLQVTGLVDWELAHAGPPGADLGHLLRLERDGAFARAVLEAYRDGVPDASETIEEILDQARAADLAALVDLAGRRGESPATERAHDLLVALARSGDLRTAPCT
jgi:aminoglycoside phosphotransferase (APT) family kinase protein